MANVLTEKKGLSGGLREEVFSEDESFSIGHSEDTNQLLRRVDQENTVSAKVNAH